MLALLLTTERLFRIFDYSIGESGVSLNLCSAQQKASPLFSFPGRVSMQDKAHTRTGKDPRPKDWT